MPAGTYNLSALVPQIYSAAIVVKNYNLSTLTPKVYSSALSNVSEPLPQNVGTSGPV